MNTLLKKLTPFIAIACGVLFLILGFKSMGDQKKYTETTGIITNIYSNGVDADGNSDMVVMVKYTANGKEFEEKLNEYSASMKINDKIAVLYNPENPSQVIKKGNLGSFLQLGLGIVAIISGIVLLIKKIF